MTDPRNLDRRDWRFDPVAYRRAVWRSALRWPALAFMAALALGVLSGVLIVVAFSQTGSPI